MMGSWSDEVLDRGDADEVAVYERERAVLAVIGDVLSRLDSERERQGITKTALAERAGLGTASVRRLFTQAAGANPTLETIARLAAELGLRVVVEPAADQAAVTAVSGRGGPRRRVGPGPAGGQVADEVRSAVGA